MGRHRKNSDFPNGNHQSQSSVQMYSEAMNRGESSTSAGSGGSVFSSMGTTASYSPTTEFYDNSPTVDDEWDEQYYTSYDFIAKPKGKEKGCGPCWKLKSHLTPSKDFPAVLPASYTSTNDGGVTCPFANCHGGPFKRVPDLERHIRVLHVRDQPIFCDYSKCSRRVAPIGRKDHTRDHYRTFHAEDIPKRSNKDKKKQKKGSGDGGSGGGGGTTVVVQEALAGEVRNLNWFRCTKCIKRVHVGEHGYHCPKCDSPCEEERRRNRERLRRERAERKKLANAGQPATAWPAGTAAAAAGLYEEEEEELGLLSACGTCNGIGIFYNQGGELVNCPKCEPVTCENDACENGFERQGNGLVRCGYCPAGMAWG